MSCCSDPKPETEAGGSCACGQRPFPWLSAICDPAIGRMFLLRFRRDLLLEFASWPPGRLEQAERLEQLRALERGVRIKVVPGERPFAGVDTPEQLQALERRGPRP